MPQRRADDLLRREGAGIPGDLEFKTRPQLAMDRIRRLAASGLPLNRAAFDEACGRSGELRKCCAKAGLAYVAVIPSGYRMTMPSGSVITAPGAVKDAVSERRSRGNGSKGPRGSGRAMTATAIPGQYLLIRRLISAPPSSPSTSARRRKAGPPP